MYMTWFICSIFAAGKSNLCIILKIKIMEENKKKKLDENQIDRDTAKASLVHSHHQHDRHTCRPVGKPPFHRCGTHSSHWCDDKHQLRPTICTGYWRHIQGWAILVWPRGNRGTDCPQQKVSDAIACWTVFPPVLRGMRWPGWGWVYVNHSHLPAHQASGRFVVRCLRHYEIRPVSHQYRRYSAQAHQSWHRISCEAKTLTKIAQGVLFGGLHLNSVSRQLLARYGGIFSQYQEKTRKSAEIIPNNSAIFIVFNKIWLSLVWHFNSFHYLCTQIIIIVLWQK